MTVYFIGAGPGAADLLTLRAKATIERCPVVLYAGSLVPKDILQFSMPSATIINTAPLSLEEIVNLLKQAAEEGKDIARIHSGDPSLYSAIAEQIQYLKKHQIEYQIIPGVPAFAAAAAALGQELTLPAISQTVILTRTSKRASAMPETESLATLGASKATLAIHLSAKNVAHIEQQLIPNYGADCPVIIAAEVSWPGETLIKTTLANLAKEIEAQKIERTAIIFVGQALGENLIQESALYDKHHDRYLKPGEK